MHQLNKKYQTRKKELLTIYVDEVGKRENSIHQSPFASQMNPLGCLQKKEH